MAKLTAEKARERIAHLKSWQEQRGLTLREEEYLEALEIAAEVLSAEPIGQVMLGDYDSEGNTPDARVVCLHDQADWENFAEGTFLYLSGGVK